MRWAALMLAVALGLAAHEATAARNSVRIVSVTRQVEPGDSLTVVASTSRRRALCGLTLRPPQRRAFSAPRTRARLGRVRWLVRIGATAAPGRWGLTVNCLGAGRAAGSFLVVAPTPPVQFTVEKAGFSQQSTGASIEIAYGLVLDNDSTTSDARDVAVHVQFLDAAGRSVTTADSTIAVIPAASRFYVAGKAFAATTATVASMTVRPTADDVTPKAVTLPAVSAVTLAPNGLGTNDVAGQLTNPYPRVLPATTTVYAVVLDAHGTVVGGGSQQTRQPVAAGASFGFHLAYFALFPTPAGATALVSVDPCGGVAAGCAVLPP